MTIPHPNRHDNPAEAECTRQGVDDSQWERIKANG